MADRRPLHAERGDAAVGRKDGRLPDGWAASLDGPASSDWPVAGRSMRNGAMRPSFTSVRRDVNFVSKRPFDTMCQFRL
ncbi:hypothetical protein [Paenibacillus sp. 32O-W]|uniref:hypothetical protein n=1 Tax=Paenibacillus sp. 32O-W TaxID=1695218 RepID=UPI0011AE6AA4|nr:hypothetical protein [Paenibacillus sp. 32O-W]